MRLTAMRTHALSACTFRMMQSLELYRDQKTLDQILAPMLTGDDKTEKVDWTKFLEGIDTVITNHYDPSSLFQLPDVPLKRLQEQSMKVGFGGTSWRTAANATWILTNCGVRRPPRAVVRAAAL